jgi:hypothetical protein
MKYQIYYYNNNSEKQISYFDTYKEALAYVTKLGEDNIQAKCKLVIKK